jgi:hypothetical protein
VRAGVEKQRTLRTLPTSCEHVPANASASKMLCLLSLCCLQEEGGRQVKQQRARRRRKAADVAYAA